MNGAVQFASAVNLFRRAGSCLMIVCTLACGSFLLIGQPSSSEDSSSSTSASPRPPAERERIFGILPNHWTAPSLENYKPLSAREKFAIAYQDSFDLGTVAVASLFAADAQLTTANPSFGPGARGYTRYFEASYANLVVGNYMSGAVFPALLHQDPRYFRRGLGSGWSRLRYALGQTFLTRADSDRIQFNYSEILGSATAVAISNAYDPDHRNGGAATATLGTQIGIHTAFNVLKEFWPDLSRKFNRKHHDNLGASAIFVKGKT